MAPILNHPQEDAERSRGGQYTFQKLLRGTAERCQGVVVHSREQEERYNRPPEREELPITLYKVWDHSISPYAEHVECMNNHVITSFNIPMGEAQFLQKHLEYAALPPHAVVGHITTRHCAQGTRLRVEIMDLMVDFEVERLDHHCSVITGPTVDGYHVNFFLRGEVNCVVVLMLFCLDYDNKTIKPHLHIYQNNTDESSNPLAHEWVDGGLLVTRNSWYYTHEHAQYLYNTVQQVVQGWASVANVHHKAWMYNLVDPWDPIKKIRLSQAKEIAMTKPFLHMSLFLCRDFLMEKSYEDEIRHVIRYHSDNPWLGQTYIGLPSSYAGRRACSRITLMIKLHERFGFITEQFVWALKHDPCADGILQLNLHLTTHCRSGLLEMSLNPRNQCAPINGDFYVQLRPRIPSPHAPNPSAYWRLCASEQRQKDWADPLVHGKEFIRKPSSGDEASEASALSLVSRSVFQDARRQIIIQQAPRPLSEHRAAPYHARPRARRGNAGNRFNRGGIGRTRSWDQTTRSWDQRSQGSRGSRGSWKKNTDRYNPETTWGSPTKHSPKPLAKWGSTSNPSENPQGEVLNSDRGNRRSVIRDIPTSTVIRPMTKEEAQRAAMFVANPGLYPIEELTNPITPLHCFSMEGQICNLYNNDIGIVANQQKLQRELCNVIRRVTALDGGASRRPNPGSRRIETQPIPVEDLQWSNGNLDWPRPQMSEPTAMVDLTQAPESSNIWEANKASESSNIWEANKASESSNMWESNKEPTTVELVHPFPRTEVVMDEPMPEVVSESGTSLRDYEKSLNRSCGSESVALSPDFVQSESVVDDSDSSIVEVTEADDRIAFDDTPMGSATPRKRK